MTPATSTPAYGKPPKGYNAFSTLDPSQAQGFQQLLQSLMGSVPGAGNWIQNLLNPSAEAQQQFEAPYLRQFHEQTVPALAERFAGLGAGGQSSSAFQQSLGQAGAGLSENLASLRGEQQQGGASLLYQILSQLLGQSNVGFSQKPQKQPGFLKQFGLGLAPGIGQAAGLGSLGGLSLIPGLGGLSKLWSG